jgi:type IV pilus assembly protein PilV
MISQISISASTRQALDRNQGGAFLLEVLISILIFSFALLGLVALQARAVQFSVNAEDRNRAALLANELVATMLTQQSVDVGTLSAEITSWQTRVRANLPPFDSTVVATVANGAENGFATADITINWTPSGPQSTSHAYATKVLLP